MPPCRRRSLTMSSKRSSPASRRKTHRASSVLRSSARAGTAWSPIPASAAASTRSTGRRRCWASSATAASTRTPPPSSPPTRRTPASGWPATAGTAAPSSSPRTAGSYSPWTCWSFLPGAAVLCAADGCDHLGCHGGPFRVVLVFADPDYPVFGAPTVKKACVYSSETGAWGEPASVSGAYMDFKKFSSVLAGKDRSLLYFMDYSVRERILEFDLAGGGFTVIEPPEEHPTTTVPDRLMLMVAEGGGLGVAETLEFSICLRKWEPSGAKWVQSRVIDLRSSLPIGHVLLEWEANAMAFAEGTDAIVVGTDTDIFTVDLRTGRVRRVLEEQPRPFSKYTEFGPVIPVVGFYTPRPRLQQAP